jgi:GT2 family glycosyltransferase
VTYNSARVLGICLDSLASRLPGAEVIVVDNGSTDETMQIAERYPFVRTIVGHGNVGFGTAVNLGAVASRALLVVINPDTRLVEYDPVILSEIAAKRDAGLLGCRMRERGHDRFAISRLWPWRVELTWALTQWFLVPREVSLSRPGFLFRRSDQWVSGAAFVTRVDEFHRAGGFDERFFLYFEDNDLSRGYHEAQLPVGTTDALTFEHAGQSSSPPNEELMITFSLLGLIQYVSKWHGSAEAERAARQCLRLLDGLVAGGRRLNGVPLVGPRAAKKSDSAATVRGALVKSISSPPRTGSYQNARAALRSALDAGNLDDATRPV